MRKRQSLGCRFVTIGTAEQVDFAAFERLNRRLPVRVAHDLDREVQRLADQAGIFGGESLVDLAASGDVEGWIVGRRGAQDQGVPALQPLRLLIRQWRALRHG